MTFATDYRALVVPRIQDEAAYQGRRVAFSCTTFANAMTMVWRTALHYGATHLPQKLQADLEDLIAGEILAAIDDAEALIARVRSGQ